MCLAKFITTKNTYWADLTRLPSYFRRKISYYYRVKAIFLIWFPSKKISIRISQDITHIFSSLSVYYIGACFWNWKYWKFFFYLKFYHVMCIAMLQCLCVSVLEWVLDILQTYFDKENSEIVKFITLWPNFLISKVVCPFFHLIF